MNPETGVRTIRCPLSVPQDSAYPQASPIKHTHVDIKVTELKPRGEQGVNNV